MSTESARVLPILRMEAYDKVFAQCFWLDAHAQLVPLLVVGRAEFQTEGMDIKGVAWVVDNSPVIDQKLEGFSGRGFVFFRKTDNRKQMEVDPGLLTVAQNLGCQPRLGPLGHMVKSALCGRFQAKEKFAHAHASEALAHLWSKARFQPGIPGKGVLFIRVGGKGVGQPHEQPR